MGLIISKSPLLNSFYENNQNNHLILWNLTKREMGIIQLMAKVFISKEIADQRHINTSTSKIYQENIKKKFEFKTVIDMGVFEFSNGWIV
jgi:DNA-binding CsgD family transcriptional regulator